MRTLQIFITGPAFFYPGVLRVMAKPLMLHRDEWFANMFIEQTEQMKRVTRLKTTNHLLRIRCLFHGCCSLQCHEA